MDTISRQAVLDYIDSMPCEVTKDGRYMIRRIRLTEYISDTLPSAEPERKKGRWEPFDLTWGRSIYFCTACNDAAEVPTSYDKPVYKYCPNCGADMRGEEDG